MTGSEISSCKFQLIHKLDSYWKRKICLLCEISAFFLCEFFFWGTNFPLEESHYRVSKKKDSQKIYLSKRQKPVQKPLLRKKKKKSIASPYNVVKPKMQGI